nr:hypothetical protein [uncultured Lichenicoccus sp.]
MTVSAMPASPSSAPKNNPITLETSGHLIEETMLFIAMTLDPTRRSTRKTQKRLRLLLSFRLAAAVHPMAESSIYDNGVS